MNINNEQLIDLIAEASHRLHSELKTAAKRGTLENYLENIGMKDLISIFEKETLFEPLPNAKIIIFGDSQVSESEIYGLAKTYNIPKDRLELNLGYQKAKTFNFRKLQYNPNYKLVLFGPIPHSVEGKGEYSNIIVLLEEEDGFPKVIKMNDGHGLKITKSGLRGVFEEQTRIGYLSYQ